MIRDRLLVTGGSAAPSTPATDHRSAITGMNSIWTIARREYSAYFTSPIAYVYLTTFLVATCWIFFRSFFLIGQADMRVFFSVMPWIFLFFVPAVAMGKWAEERRQGTLEILFTLPIRDRDVVLAKFAASLSLIATALLLTLPIPLSVAGIGNLDWGPVIGGYLGLVFLGGAFLAIGLVASALTENQIVAFIAGVVASFVMMMMGTPLIAGGKAGFFTQAISYVGLGTHFESISRGVVDSRDVVYYLSVIGFFLYMNLKVLETKARR